MITQMCQRLMSRSRSASRSVCTNRSLLCQCLMPRSRRASRSVCTNRPSINRRDPADSLHRQGCRYACGDATTGPSDSDGVHDHGRPADAVRWQSYGGADGMRQVACPKCGINQPFSLAHLCPGLAPCAAPWRWFMARAHQGQQGFENHIGSASRTPLVSHASEAHFP